MKANELMIGDWVNFLDFEDCMDKDVQWTAEDYIEKNVDYCNPIHLDEDTLEENNFVCINGDWCYGSFYFSTRRDGSCYINIAGQKVTIQCVHELQHALRLCGLTELADNFKLEAIEE